MPEPDAPSPLPGSLPLALKLGVTLWMAVWVPTWALHHGPSHFLWFCDAALFLVFVGIWMESALLLSAQGVALLVVQLVWVLDFLFGFLFGWHPFGATAYMFDALRPIHLRAMSAGFHLGTVPVVIYALSRLGYDRRGFPLQTAITWLLLPATFLLTDPEKNVNWLDAPFGFEQVWMPPALFLLVAMAAYPIGLYHPAHVALRAWARRTGRLVRLPS